MLSRISEQLGLCRFVSRANMIGQIRAVWLGQACIPSKYDWADPSSLAWTGLYPEQIWLGRSEQFGLDRLVSRANMIVQIRAVWLGQACIPSKYDWADPSSLAWTGLYPEQIWLGRSEQLGLCRFVSRANMIGQIRAVWLGQACIPSKYDWADPSSLAWTGLYPEQIWLGRSEQFGLDRLVSRANMIVQIRAVWLGQACIPSKYDWADPSSLAWTGLYPEQIWLGRSEQFGLDRLVSRANMIGQIRAVWLGQACIPSKYDWADPSSLAWTGLYPEQIWLGRSEQFGLDRLVSRANMIGQIRAVWLGQACIPSKYDWAGPSSLAWASSDSRAISWTMSPYRRWYFLPCRSCP